MSDNAEYGGQRALLGFYYQMLATLGAMTVGCENPSDTTSFIAKFQIDSTTRFLPECLGQDLMISTGSHICLVQFKHSGSVYGGTIGQADIWEVLNSFRKSVLKAESEQILRQSITACVLITNRILVGEGLTVQEWAQKCQQECGIDGSRVSASAINVDVAKLRQISDTKTGRSIADIVKEHLEGEFAGLTDRGQADRKLRKAVDDTLFVLTRLFIRTEINVGTFETKVNQLARQHGATEAEVDVVGAVILGEILQCSLTGSQLTVQNFLKCLTGSQEAIPLTPEGIGPACFASWKEWKETQGAGLIKLHPRDPSDILEKLQRHKMVFIIGDGGVGKTELLVALTESIAEAAKTSQTFEGFPVLVQSLVLQAEWLEQKIGEWAQRTIASPTKVWQLLKVANDSANRILLICIDGIDEHHPSEDIIRRFYQMAPKEGVRFLVTSRPDAAKVMMDRILGGNSTASGKFLYADMSVQVRTFLPEELQQAIAATFQHQLDYMFGSNGGFGMASNMFPTSFVDSTIFESLRHPRMFGAFATLTGNVDLAQSFLEGRSDVVRQVARLFLQRFFKKYAQRHRDIPASQFKPKWHAEVYKDIAINTRGIGKQSISKWNEIVTAKSRPQQIDADQLFLEATTGGLVVEAEGEWYWRHAFVADCLAEDAADSYLEG